MTKETEIQLATMAQQVNEIHEHYPKTTDMIEMLSEAFDKHVALYHKGVSWTTIAKSMIPVGAIVGPIVAAILSK